MDLSGLAAVEPFAEVVQVPDVDIAHLAARDEGDATCLSLT